MITEAALTYRDQKGVGKWYVQEQLGKGQWRKKGMSWSGVPGTETEACCQKQRELGALQPYGLQGWKRTDEVR